MSLHKVLKIVGEAVSRRASVHSVVGAPVVVGERTFLPVARIQYGFGGGDNNGVIGSGGGMEAIPLGLIELSAEGVVFHPLPIANEPQAAPPEASQVVPGIWQLDSAGLPCCWLLVNGEQAAVVNAPPNAALATVLVEQASRLGAEVRHLLLTSCDYRHAGGISDLVRVFPQARVVAHRSVEHCPAFPPKPGPGEAEPWREHIPTHDLQVHGFDSQLWSEDLDGEPLFALYAPRHRWTDGLVLFRGALLVGHPGPAEVSMEVAQRVRRDLLEILSGPYRINHTLYSGGEMVAGLDPDLFN